MTVINMQPRWMTWNGVCTRAAVAGDPIGQACGQCGHSNLLHPHAWSNPALSACVVCQLLAEGSDQDPQDVVVRAVAGGLGAGT